MALGNVGLEVISIDWVKVYCHFTVLLTAKDAQHVLFNLLLRRLAVRQFMNLIKNLRL